MEKLESECQIFQALALAEGLSRKDALRIVAALEFADKLMWLPTVEDSLKLMQSKSDNAQAFWHVMEIVLDRARAGKMRPEAPPMKANGPLATLASTVLEYCHKLDEQYPDRF